MQHCQVVQGLGDRLALLAEGLLANLQGPPVERLRLRVASLLHIEEAEIVQHLRDLGMVRTKAVLVKPQRPLVQPFGVAPVALRVVDGRQIGEHGSVLCLAGAKPVDGELGDPQLLLRLLVAALRIGLDTGLSVRFPGLRLRARGQQQNRHCGQSAEQRSFDGTHRPPPP